MIKGESMKKKVWIIIVIILLCLLSASLFFFFNQEKDESIKDKLKNSGYSDNEVALILNKVSNDDYDSVLKLGYDKSLISILSSSDYQENLFENYIEYYVKNKDELLPFIQQLTEKFSFKEVVPISAQRGNNVHQLKAIVRQSLRKGVHHFPEEYVTDRSQRFMASEIIREKLMRFMGEELPYSVTVEIEQFKINERGTYEINGLILVERDGQKKMVIGHQGQKLKTIGTEARQDMQRLFDAKVHLELWVKVKSGWADDERALRSLGYMDD